VGNEIYRIDSQLRTDQRFLAATVGAVAFLLPVVLGLGSILNPPLRQSISHFYYVPFFGDMLVGGLFFIGTFLIAYRGLLPQERTISNVAGFAAFGIALFPTTGPGLADGRVFSRVLTQVTVVKEVPALDTAYKDYYSLFPYVGFLHFFCAAVLFGFLAYCALFVFTRRSARNPHDVGQRPKKLRNGIYKACGAVIVLCMVAMLAKLLPGVETRWNAYDLTFVFEALALFSFGLSWLVKGRFFMMASILMDSAEREEQAHMKAFPERM